MKRIGLSLILLIQFVCLLVARTPIEETPESGPLPQRGVKHPELEPFDHLMEDFLPRHQLVGASIAVARQGHVVHERGFGWSDRQARQPVEPRALFRIASISKPITAVAILQLIERGKFKIQDRIFDLLQLNPPDNSPFDERWRKVTVLQLLQHTGGWDRSQSYDPMFISPRICKALAIAPPAGQEAIIRYMLRQPLQFDPGERFAYSNFGYCLLGRIVEKFSGLSYEEYVRKEVLAPLGIVRMRLGQTLLKDRAAEEVHYYTPDDQTAPAVVGPDLGQAVPLPYGAWNLEAMDAHGGWIASAGDLVRFASAFDHPATCKILKAETIALLFAPPPGRVGHREDGRPKETFYSCGWQVRPMEKKTFHSWHSGSLDGTSSLLVRRSDGLTWAVLFNCRPGGGKPDPATRIDPLLHQAANAVKTWPTH